MKWVIIHIPQDEKLLIRRDFIGNIRNIDVDT